ncbi:MAG: ECF-type sigma factor [Myxococcota bacterium]
MGDFEVQLDDDVYHHLHRLAERIFAERGRGHATVQPTAILHEAWLKLADGRFDSERHFVAVAARAMRQILIDRGRAKSRDKRGGPHQRQVTLSGLADSPRDVDLIDLDRALTELEAVDPRGAEIAMLRTFGGLSIPEVAETLGVSERTIQREWRAARAFVVSRMGGDDTP